MKKNKNIGGDLTSCACACVVRKRKTLNVEPLPQRGSRAREEHFVSSNDRPEGSRGRGKHDDDDDGGGRARSDERDDVIKKEHKRKRTKTRPHRRTAGRLKVKNFASSLFVVSLSVDAPSPNVSLYDAAPCTLLIPDDAITAANATTTTCHVVVLLRRATMVGARVITLWRERKQSKIFSLFSRLYQRKENRPPEQMLNFLFQFFSRHPVDKHHQ